jgi:uncharacterized protein GlcG (DUF336 family)
MKPPAPAWVRAPVHTKETVMRTQASNPWLLSAALLALPLAASAADDATFSVRMLTPESAQKAVNAALAACRKAGYQVAVAVVDRSGVTQALIRDRFAGPHTPGVATDKAWTAVSFRTDTTELGRATQPGQPSSGLRSVPRVAAFGGGVMIQGGGSLLGAIGVSGAPTGEADDVCAKAGIAAIQADLEM